MNLQPLVVYGLAELYPYEVETSEDLVEALAFLQSPYDAETIVRAGYGAGLVALMLVIPLMIFIPMLAAILMAATVSVIAIHTVHTLPKLSAAMARTRALGETPNLIGRIVLRMQIQPALENAVTFAAESGNGPLSDSLHTHIDSAIGTPRTGLLLFADEWSDQFPAIRRSASLLATAQDAPPSERRRALDRSLTAILDGTRNTMADFTSKIQGPTTALYAFGVMLPLALVALLPAVGITGYQVSIWYFVIIYNIMLPAFLVGAGFWLLIRRPVAFPPPNVTRNHPDVPDHRWPAVVWGLGCGVAAYVLTAMFGPPHLAPIAGIGLGLAPLLIVYYRPIMLVRNYVKDVEEHLVDALYLCGRLVSEDESVETAIQESAEKVPAETGEVFADASWLQSKLHLGVHEAFHGEYGALRDIPSPRANSTADLLAIASYEGQPAGHAIVSMADHLEELLEVEAETKRRLSAITGTLNTTAAFFGPMVAGATVGLAGGMSGDAIDALDDAVIVPIEQLAIVIGVYVILLCFILVPLSITLKHGFDKSLVGYKIGTTLLTAIPIYVITTEVITTVM